jgi:enoyl-CoA hydratase/carnithine racemase
MCIMMCFNTVIMTGLTGVRLNAADLMATGIATHFVPRYYHNYITYIYICHATYHLRNSSVLLHSDRIADLEASLCAYTPNASYSASTTTATTTAKSTHGHGHKHHHSDAAAAATEARTADAVRFIEHELAKFATLPPASSGESSHLYIALVT